MEEKKYKIGYLDEEELWQAQALKKLSPFFHVELIELPIPLTDIWPYIIEKELDAIIVDFRLFESGEVSFDGAEVVADICKHNEHFPMFIMTSYENNAIDQADNVLIIRGKEILTDDKAVGKFAKVLQATISSYYNKINMAKDILFTIEGKISKGIELTPEDDNKRFKAELFLSETDKDNKIPQNMNTIGYSQQINKLLELAKDLEKSLKNK